MPNSARKGPVRTCKNYDNHIVVWNKVRFAQVLCVNFICFSNVTEFVL